MNRNFIRPMIKRSGTVPRWREYGGWIVPAIGLTLLPKCPACVCAYLLALTGIGLDVAVMGSVRWVLLGVCMCLIGYLALRALRNRKFFPLVLIMVGAGLMTFHQLQGVSAAARYAAVGLMIGGAVWLIRLPARSSHPSPGCCCDSSRVQKTRKSTVS